MVTPSWPVSLSPSPDPSGELERGIAALRDLGFEPVLGEHALADTGFAAGTAQQRAADINAMFADPSIRAVIASHGGHVATGVLEHLDWDLIAAHPTILMGFSNICILTAAVHAVTGVITFHGNMVMWNLGMNPTDYELSELISVLSDGRTGPVPKSSEWVTVRNGQPGLGRLIGDAAVLRDLADTPYRLDIDGDVVLFFEGMSDPPGATDSMLRHLKYMGVFEHVRGVLVGNDGAAFTGSAPEVPFTEILRGATEGYEFPIVQCDDFGHGCPNTVLPIGVTARLDPTDATLEVLEPAVA